VVRKIDPGEKLKKYVKAENPENQYGKYRANMIFILVIFIELPKTF